jgi:hypothetical protein
MKGHLMKYQRGDYLTLGNRQWQVIHAYPGKTDHKNWYMLIGVQEPHEYKEYTEEQIKDQESYTHTLYGQLIDEYMYKIQFESQPYSAESNAYSLAVFYLRPAFINCTSIAGKIGAIDYIISVSLDADQYAYIVEHKSQERADRALATHLVIVERLIHYLEEIGDQSKAEQYRTQLREFRVQLSKEAK